MTIGSSLSPMRVSAFPKAVLFFPPQTSCGLVIIRLLMLRVIPANGFSLVKSSWPGSYVNLSLSLHLLAVWISGSCGRRVYAEACPGNAGVFFWARYREENVEESQRDAWPGCFLRWILSVRSGWRSCLFLERTKYVHICLHVPREERSVPASLLSLSSLILSLSLTHTHTHTTYRAKLRDS